jgi:hypothetical protein
VLLCTVPNMARPVRWLEWLLRLAVRSPLGAIALAATVRSGQRRACQYLTYLGTSCQRRRIRWWRTAARRAGFEPVPARRAPGEPLSLLVFALPGGGTGHQPETLGER